MKSNFFATICTIVCISISCNVFALTPPSAVNKAFKEKFPNAQKIKWGKEGKAEYEANFVENGTEMSANFDINGKWLETEKEIPITEIPEKVKSAIMKKYPTCKVTGGDIITTSTGITKYEADLTIGKKKTEVQCDVEGNFIK